MAYLQEMYEGHGASAHWVDNWIIVDGGKLLTRVSIVKFNRHGNQFVMQVDFVTALPAGEQIIESFAGIGADRLSAMRDACASFSDATFHALITAILDRSCTHAEREQWHIGGKERVVTLGMLRTRGTLPSESWPAIFQAIQSQVEKCDIPAGLHWMRYYYCHIPDDQPVIEVLLDNEMNTEMQAQMEHFPWPASDTFYSARLFFIIQDL